MISDNGDALKALGGAGGAICELLNTCSMRRSYLAPTAHLNSVSRAVSRQQRSSRMWSRVVGHGRNQRNKRALFFHYLPTLALRNAALHGGATMAPTYAATK